MKLGTLVRIKKETKYARDWIGMWGILIPTNEKHLCLLRILYGHNTDILLHQTIYVEPNNIEAIDLNINSSSPCIRECEECGNLHLTMQDSDDYICSDCTYNEDDDGDTNSY